jgi:aminoglycoside phosphotransferase (APT) family kinase protein
VPTPRPVALCEDEAVTGAVFYVMELVDGFVLRGPADVEAAFAESERRAVGDALIDTLVALHAVDPDAAGLGQLGRRDGYAERQLKRWKRQWDASKTRPLAAMDETYDRLSRHVPAQRDVAVVHGDYRLDNAIVAPSGAIAAVVDWELCTLGDPIADLGLLLVYWAEPGDAIVPLTDAPSLAGGFPRRAELAERYAEQSGRDITALPFFVALSRWKLAAILEGVYARYSAGAYGRTADEFRSFATIVEQLAEMALADARAF